MGDFLTRSSHKRSIGLVEAVCPDSNLATASQT